jgi:tRNA dimethylallyltransferase
MSSDPVAIVLVGPTASGKTALLDELFGDASARQARGLPEAEVVSADSMQAYRGLDIGTAKPDSSLLSRLPHRLIDIRDCREQYSVGDFVHLADEACAEIARAGKLPIVAGGTGFYVKNFICGLPSAPAADPELRAAIAAELEERGAAALRAELEASDPVSARRIHPHDLYRLTRALEILRSTGRPLADFAPQSGARPGRSFAVFGVARPREELYDRIDLRVDAMMAGGLPEELRALREAGHGPEEPGMQAIGYREFFELAPSGSPSAGELSAIAEAIKRDTRQYAKRQMTFFRSLPGIEWIAPDPDALGRVLASRLASIVQSERFGL